MLDYNCLLISNLWYILDAFHFINRHSSLASTVLNKDKTTVLASKCGVRGYVWLPLANFSLLCAF